MLKNNIDFYVEHGNISNPKQHIKYFKIISSDIDTICKIIHNVLMHAHDGGIFNYEIPYERRSELQIRTITEILDCIFSLNQDELLNERLIHQRKISTCRDFSLLACSILRTLGIPARVRYGFGKYFYSQFYHDTTVLEYWNTKKHKWCYVDISTTDVQIISHRYNVNFDLKDIPNDQFLTSAFAWKSCRAGQIKSTLFGGGSMREYKGFWYIRNKLIQDLASLNKFEMLLWDCWGYPLINKMGVDPYEESELKVMDNIAEVLINDNINIDELQYIYNTDKYLKVPLYVDC